MSVHPISGSDGSSDKGYCTPESELWLDAVGHTAVTGSLSNVLDDYVVFPIVLGEGRYGCVRECVHRSSRKTYACKSIDKSRIGRLDHLQREVNLLSEMDHKGIVKMIDCYEDADYVHLVTEKYTGGELFDTIIRHKTGSGCCSEETSARITKSILESVAYLHDNGVCHRDINPQNILLSEGGVTKLIDFGLSRRHRKGDPPMRNPVGTAYYMAPELLEGKYDKACDVWSVGTIVHILLAGYPPFNGEEDSDIYQSILDGNLELHSEQWSCKSDEAKDLVKRLLERDPCKRLTAKEALGHPWIVNLGKKSTKPRSTSSRRTERPVRYLRIP